MKSYRVQLIEISETMQQLSECIATVANNSKNDKHAMQLLNGFIDGKTLGHIQTLIDVTKEA